MQLSAQQLSLNKHNKVTNNYEFKIQIWHAMKRKYRKHKKKKKEIEKTKLKLTSSLEKAECVSSILLQISISVELLLTLRVLFWLEERGILPSKEW